MIEERANVQDVGRGNTALAEVCDESHRIADVGSYREVINAGQCLGRLVKRGLVDIGRNQCQRMSCEPRAPRRFVLARSHRRA